MMIPKVPRSPCPEWLGAIIVLWKAYTPRAHTATLTAKKQVLLADDDKSVREFLVEALGDDERYALLEAADGEQALEVARRRKPNLIFLDVLMPKKNGFEVCRELKRDPATAGITVVILTALGQDDAREEGLNAGADDYLTKPFSPLALIGKVEQILGLTETHLSPAPSSPVHALLTSPG